MSERRLARILHGSTPTLFEAPPGAGEGADLVVIGVPYEGVLVGDRHTLYPPGATPPTSLYARRGADLAPAAIREASVFYSLEHDGGVAADLDFRPLTDLVKVVDSGDHDLGNAEHVARQAAAAGATTIGLGGDHLVPWPLVHGRQSAHRHDLGVVVLDSHLDLHAAPPLWAGSQWRMLIEAGDIDPRRLVLIGSRGVRHSLAEIDYARAEGVTVIPLSAWRDAPQACGDHLGRALAGCDQVYVSLDIDVVDPAFCPAQKYPDADGMNASEVLGLIRASCGIAPLAGFDINCLSPIYDEGHRGALFAARCALEAVIERARRQAALEVRQ